MLKPNFVFEAFTFGATNGSIKYQLVGGLYDHSLDARRLRDQAHRDSAHSENYIGHLDNRSSHEEHLEYHAETIV